MLIFDRLVGCQQPRAPWQAVRHATRPGMTTPISSEEPAPTSWLSRSTPPMALRSVLLHHSLYSISCLFFTGVSYVAVNLHFHQLVCQTILQIFDQLVNQLTN